MKWKIVYFDDQPLNIVCYQEFLKDQFNIIGVSDSTSYLDVIKNEGPHLYLIDVHMPVMDGHTLGQKIQDHPLYNGCPIIYISGDETIENKIKSYQRGGADFISRHLSPEEVMIRIMNKVKFFVENSGYFQLGNLDLDMKSLVVRINHEAIDLTLIELRLLAHVLRAYPQILTREILLQEIWQDDSVKPGTINTHLTHLKSKIQKWDHQIKVREENVLILAR